MLTLDIKYFTSQLERIIVELNTGNRVMITHQGRPHEELYPYTGSPQQVSSIIQTHYDRGWRGSRSRNIVMVYDKTPIALVLRQSRCGRIQRMLYILDDIMSHPWQVIESFIYLSRTNASTEECRLLST